MLALARQNNKMINRKDIPLAVDGVDAFLNRLMISMSYLSLTWTLSNFRMR